MKTESEKFGSIYIDFEVEEEDNDYDNSPEEMKRLEVIRKMKGE